MSSTSKTISTGDLDSFFEKRLYNDCQAIEELIRHIEASQSEALARRALDLFQKHYASLERPWDHETFMYGLGLIYMHFNAYNWAVRSFRVIVYMEPGFKRSRDIHARLGLIFKTTGRYRLSEKHFNLAINDARANSGTTTKQELEFHLAHLSEIQGKTKQAIELYEKLLQEKDLPPKLSANIHRQLGWIHYSTAITPSLPSKNESRYKNDSLFSQSLSADPRKLDAALDCLNTSYKTDGDSQTSYCLGRCLTHVGKFQDAFTFYRSMIDKEESTADTWCSLGVLYHRQNQPWDALQAYIRSVQYDKKHAVAWMNLGILYESHNQYKDALKCYQHVLRSNLSGNNDKSIQNRVLYIQRHMNDIETASTSNNGKLDTNPNTLLSLEDLWNMESKTNQENSVSNSNSNKSDIRQMSTPIHNSLKIPNQMPEHNSIKQNQTSSATSSDQSNNDHAPQLNINNSVRCQTGELPEERSCNGQSMNEIDYPAVKKAKVEDINLTNTIGDSSEVVDEMKTKMHPESNQLVVAHRADLTADKNLKEHEGQFKTVLNLQFQDPKENCLKQIFTNGASKDSGISSDSSTYTDCTLVPSHSTANYPSAEQVIELCKNSSAKLKRIDINLISDDTKPPPAFPRPPAYPPIPSEKLFPLPPSIFLESKKDLSSRKLQEICQSNPISIMRNIASVLKLDLGLFSTKTLVESNPDEKVDIVSHLSYQNLESSNSGDLSKASSWSCERHKSHSTISLYASYQVDSFLQSIQEECDNRTKPLINKESETDSNESAIARKNGEITGSPRFNDSQSSKSIGTTNKRSKKDEVVKIKSVKFANLIDLSDEQKWRPQLNELNKLPYFLRCVSASNMLTHVGIAIPGLNTNSLSMHVPGCRMIGNKTPNNFCHIVINIGPGDYEWSAIPGEYEGVLKKLCNRNGFDVKEDDWWPNVEDLHRYNIPVYKFAQRPGDLVWVNSSTFYWVQASGWANNLQWNVGPLSSKQYRLAAESCELDKLMFRKSSVPLVQMTWNIVININIITDDELFQQMTSIMRRSLVYCHKVLEIIEELGKDTNTSDGEPGPASPKFCSLCDCEVFNISFKSELNRSIYCLECALRTEAIQEYTIDQVYSLDFMMKLYDRFIETKKKSQAQ